MATYKVFRTRTYEDIFTVTAKDEGDIEGFVEDIPFDGNLTFADDEWDLISEDDDEDPDFVVE